MAATATRDATLQANFLTAVQSYLFLAFCAASVDALQVAEASAKESLAAAEARYRAGIATPADKLQAQTALSQARAQPDHSSGQCAQRPRGVGEQHGIRRQPAILFGVRCRKRCPIRLWSRT